jgi:hypothetical protein
MLKPEFLPASNVQLLYCIRIPSYADPRHNIAGVL